MSRIEEQEGEPKPRVYPRRFFRKRKQPAPLHGAEKRLKCNADIKDLPDELLLEIFSRLSKVDVLLNVQNVCRRWSCLSTDKSLLGAKIKVGEDPPTETLKRWIRATPKLVHLVIRDRKDVTEILDEVSQHCTRLQFLEIFDCWGSSTSKSVRHLTLYLLLRNCRCLSHFRFKNVLFNQQKYFGLLVNQNYMYREWLYCGWISKRQLKFLLQNSSHSFRERHRIRQAYNKNVGRFKIVYKNRKIKIV